MYKKITIVFLIAMLILMTACTSQNEEPSSTSSQDALSQSEPSSSSESAQSKVEADAKPSTEDAAEYQMLIADVIARYADGSIETNEMFPALPEGLEFPDDISDLEFQVDEMGYTTTLLVDKTNTYEIYIRIDDMTDAGVRPEGTPYVRSFHFSQVS